MSDIDLIPRTPIYISDTRRRWPGYYIEDRYKNPLEEMQAAIEDTVIKYRSDVYVPDYLIMKELVKKLLEQGIEGDLNITYCEVPDKLRTYSTK